MCFSQIHYVFSLKFIGDLINYTFLESSEHGESKNVCWHLHRHLQSWGPIDFTTGKATG